MRSPRYTILIANRNTGVVRRLTVARRSGLLLASGLFAIPLFIGLGASGGNPTEVEALRLQNESLRLENESYRAATGELAEQISSLQTALTELGDQTQLDPVARRALENSFALRRARAAGGAVPARAPIASTTPEGTFGVLRNLLGVLENRIASVKTKVEGEQAKARSTPTIWPIVGWLSSGFGHRRDPFDGTADTHYGLDIAADRGTAIRATADGRVESVGYHGNYGNSILISHGYGISTRFGHLSGFAVVIGQTVTRNQTIGFVGSTGRATNPHLHYEILINGNPIDPLRLLAKP